MGFRSCCIAATGAFALTPVTRKRGGGSAIRSPWLAPPVNEGRGPEPGVRLAHPSRDQLGVLRSVVEDQDPVHAWYQVVGSSTSPRSRSSSVSRWRAR